MVQVWGVFFSFVIRDAPILWCFSNSAQVKELCHKYKRSLYRNGLKSLVFWSWHWVSGLEDHWEMCGVAQSLQIACPRAQWTQGKSFIILYSEIEMLVWHILMQRFFHQTMPTWNQTSLWNQVGYNMILADTRQLPEKTFFAVHNLKPASCEPAIRHMGTRIR